MSCFPEWLSKDTQVEDQQVQEEEDDWQSHFGYARLKLVSLKDKDNYKHWKKDRIMCPSSLRNKHAKPHALELVNTQASKQSPIQVQALSHHAHSANHAFVQLQMDTTKQDPYAFILSVVHQNKVFHLGTDGLSLTPSYVHVWLWQVEDKENFKHSKVKGPHRPGERAQDFIVITDATDQYVLQTVLNEGEHKHTVEFSKSISSNLLDAVFFVAPVHGFEHSYVQK
jgi:hypothetical protein